MSSRDDDDDGFESLLLAIAAGFMLYQFARLAGFSFAPAASAMTMPSPPGGGGGGTGTSSPSSPGTAGGGTEIQTPATPATPAAGGGHYRSLTAGGFFSSDPNNLRVPRSIRTNNPGALNIASWIRSFPGFAGTTQPDKSGNVTAVFFAPEFGVAAWFHLIHDLYGFDKSVMLPALIARYEGTNSSSVVSSYLAGLVRGAGGALSRDATVNMQSMGDVLALARGMFYQEAGRATPLSDAQITNGIQWWLSGQLPAS